MPDIKVTWESADTVPSAIIQEFEKGIQAEAEMHTIFHYGQEKCTLAINKSKTSQGLAVKKPRRERKVIEGSTGYDLQMQTELKWPLITLHS